MEQVRSMEHFQSRQEERYNSITHGLMGLLVVLALPFAVGHIYRTIAAMPMVAAVSVAVFGTCLILMFGTSAIYHGLPAESRFKQLFHRLDHMAIYFAIAGSYTPLALVVIGGTAGLTMFLVEWALVLAGVLFKILAFPKSKFVSILSTTLYLLMGWVMVIFLPTFFIQASLACGVLIIAGGVMYSGGIIFFALKRNFSHVIWHLFVNAGALCHFLAIVLFLN